jgi:hypothetical protein
LTLSTATEETTPASPSSGDTGDPPPAAGPRGFPTPSPATPPPEGPPAKPARPWEGGGGAVSLLSSAQGCGRRVAAVLGAAGGRATAGEGCVSEEVAASGLGGAGALGCCCAPACWLGPRWSRSGPRGPRLMSALAARPWRGRFAGMSRGCGRRWKEDQQRLRLAGVVLEVVSTSAPGVRKPGRRPRNSGGLWRRGGLRGRWR